MSTFLKKDEVELINGGYLSNKSGLPVTNSDFVSAQQHAHYIVTFAKLAKGKDFNGKKADSISDLKEEVTKALSKSDTIYVKQPKEISRPVTESLKSEALAFMEFEEKSNSAQKVNKFMQQFNVLNEFETFGLFFESGIVKLEKIYTVKEILAAIESVIELISE